MSSRSCEGLTGILKLRLSRYPERVRLSTTTRTTLGPVCQRRCRESRGTGRGSRGKAPLNCGPPPAHREAKAGSLTTESGWRPPCPRPPPSVQRGPGLQGIRVSLPSGRGAGGLRGEAGRRAFALPFLPLRLPSSREQAPREARARSLPVWLCRPCAGGESDRYELRGPPSSLRADSARKSGDLQQDVPAACLETSLEQEVLREDCRFFHGFVDVQG